MRYLIFSDIHGNLEAFDVLLRFAAKRKIDHYVCLGDLVGYGASPNEIIRKVRALKPLSLIRGNHDKAVSGQDSIETFNPIAAAAIRWTQKTISKTHAEFLHKLPKGPQAVDGRFTICHGAPFDEDYYIFGDFDADEAFDYQPTALGFFGHTHFPFLYARKGEAVRGDYKDGRGGEFKLEKGVSYLINPGSVGQPRDRNPQSAFAVYDSDRQSVRFHRAAYDIAAAQKKIHQAELPPALAERLIVGI
jgi:predicted phosphodiesterase